MPWNAIECRRISCQVLQVCRFCGAMTELNRFNEYASAAISPSRSQHSQRRFTGLKTERGRQKIKSPAFSDGTVFGTDSGDRLSRPDKKNPKDSKMRRKLMKTDENEWRKWRKWRERDGLCKANQCNCWAPEAPCEQSTPCTLSLRFRVLGLVLAARARWTRKWQAWP